MTRLELMKLTRTRKGMKLAGAHTCIGSAKLRDLLRQCEERRVYYGTMPVSQFADYIVARGD